MSFTNSMLVSAGNAVVYQVIDTVSQYADQYPQWTQFMTNGEVIMIASGLVLTGVAYYAYQHGYDLVAALSIELGPLLLISGILDIFKRKMNLSQIAQVRRAPPPPAKVIAPAPAQEKLSFTPML